MPPNAVTVSYPSNYRWYLHMSQKIPFSYLSSLSQPAFAPTALLVLAVASRFVTKRERSLAFGRMGRRTFSAKMERYTPRVARSCFST